MALLLALAGHTGVAQVLGDTMGPAVRDGFSVAVEPLGDLDFGWFLVV